MTYMGTCEFESWRGVCYGSAVVRINETAVCIAHCDEQMERAIGKVRRVVERAQIAFDFSRETVRT